MINLLFLTHYKKIGKAWCFIFNQNLYFVKPLIFSLFCGILFNGVLFMLCQVSIPGISQNFKKSDMIF